MPAADRIALHAVQTYFSLHKQRKRRRKTWLERGKGFCGAFAYCSVVRLLTSEVVLNGGAFPFKGTNFDLATYGYRATLCSIISVPFGSPFFRKLRGIARNFLRGYMQVYEWGLL
jgi:hypothetical protein